MPDEFMSEALREIIQRCEEVGLEYWIEEGFSFHWGEEAEDGEKPPNAVPPTWPTPPNLEEIISHLRFRSFVRYLSLSSELGTSLFRFSM